MTDDFDNALGEVRRDSILEKASRYGLRLNSGARSAGHNAAVGGVKNSYHLTGNAGDFVGSRESMRAFHDDLKANHPDVAELLDENDHIHVAWHGASVGNAKKAKPAPLAAPDEFDTAWEAVKTKPSFTAGKVGNVQHTPRLDRSSTTVPVSQATTVQPDMLYASGKVGNVQVTQLPVQPFTGPGVNVGGVKRMPVRGMEQAVKPQATVQANPATQPQMSNLDLFYKRKFDEATGLRTGDIFTEGAPQADKAKAQEYASKLKELGWEAGEGTEGWWYVKPPTGRTAPASQGTEAFIGGIDARAEQKRTQDEFARNDQRGVVRRLAEGTSRGVRVGVDELAAGAGRLIRNVQELPGDVGLGMSNLITSQAEQERMAQQERAANPASVSARDPNAGERMQRFYEQRGDEAKAAQELRGQDLASKAGFGVGSAAPFLIPGTGPVAFGVESGLSAYGSGAPLSQSILTGMINARGLAGGHQLGETLAARMQNPVTRFAGRMAGTAAGLETVRAGTGGGIPDTPEAVAHEALAVLGFTLMGGRWKGTAEGHEALGKMLQDSSIHPDVKIALADAFENAEIPVTAAQPRLVRGRMPVEEGGNERQRSDSLQRNPDVGNDRVDAASSIPRTQEGIQGVSRITEPAPSGTASTARNVQRRVESATVEPPAVNAEGVGNEARARLRQPDNEQRSLLVNATGQDVPIEQPAPAAIATGRDRLANIQGESGASEWPTVDTTREAGKAETLPPPPRVPPQAVTDALARLRKSVEAPAQETAKVVQKVSEPLPQQEAAPKAREPWEMTQGEYATGKGRSLQDKPSQWWEDQGVERPEGEKITVYRGVPGDVEGDIRPGDFVSLEKRTAEAYAGTTASRGGKVISKEVPLSDVYIGDTGASYDDFRYAPAHYGYENLKLGVGLEPRQTYGELAIEHHRRLVKRALAAGDSVPDSVLADYPDLQAKPETPKPSPPPTPVAERATTRARLKAEGERQAEAYKDEKSGLERAVDKVESPPTADKSAGFGKRHTDSAGQEWELVSQNDKNVPYFSKVANGKVQKRRFTMGDGERIANELAAKSAQPEAAKVKDSVAEDLYRQGAVYAGKEPDLPNMRDARNREMTLANRLGVDLDTMRERAMDAYKRGYGNRNTFATKEAKDAALDVLTDKDKRHSGGPSTEELRALATVAAYHIEATGREFADFAKYLKDEIGDAYDKYSPHIRAVWDEAIGGKNNVQSNINKLESVSEDRMADKANKPTGVDVSGQEGVEPHHSQLQPRNEHGEFDGPPQKAESQTPETLRAHGLYRGEKLFHDVVTDQDAFDRGRQYLADNGIDAAIAHFKAKESPDVTDKAIAGAAMEALQERERAVRGSDPNEADRLLHQQNDLAAEYAAKATIQARGLRGNRVVAEEFGEAAAVLEAQKVKAQARPFEKLTADETRRITDTARELKETNDALAAKLAEAETRRAKAEAELLDANTVLATERATKRLAREEALSSRRGRRAVTQETLQVERSDLLGQLSKIAGRHQMSMGILPPDAVGIIGKLARNLIKSGYTKAEGLIDELYNQVRTVYEDVTKREVGEAFSGYGKTQQMSRDDIAVKVRELKAIEREILKLEDVEGGERPLRSGLQREAPTQELRERQQKVRDAMRDAGMQMERAPKDPAAQLKTALDSVKIRLRNEIADKTKRLDALNRGEKPAARTREQLQYDADANRLKTERDALNKQLEAIEGPKQMTDEQRAKIAGRSLDRAIADAERDVNAGTYTAKQKGRVVTSPELEAKRTRLAELKEQRNALKPPKSQAQLNVEARRRLTKSIAEYERRLREKDYTTKPKKEAFYDKETIELQEKQAQLRRKYNQDIDRLRPMYRTRKVGRFLLNVINLQRAMKASSDFFGGVVRQGRLLSADNLKIAGQIAFKDQFKTLSKVGYEAAYEGMKANPNLRTLQRFGVEFTGEPLRKSGALSERSEDFQYDWADKIPGVSHSQRSFDASLDLIRLKAGSDYVDSLKAQGITPENNPKAYADLAKWINYASGRGSFGKTGNKLATALSPVFFAPRYRASRVQALRMAFGPNVSPSVRKIALRSTAKYYGATASILALGALAGVWKVSLDPDDADFLKARFGDKHLDLTGGEAGDMRLMFRLFGATQRKVTGTTNAPGQDVKSIMERYFQSTLSPGAGVIYHAWTGRDFKGDKANVLEEFATSFIPMSADALYEGWREAGGPSVSEIVKEGFANVTGERVMQGLGGAASALPAVASINLNTYKEADEDLQEVRRLATKYKQAHDLPLGEASETISPYRELRRALETNDPHKARMAFNDVRKEVGDDDKMYEAMKGWSERGFVGDAVKDAKFEASLSLDQLGKLTNARKAKDDTWGRFLDLWTKSGAESETATKDDIVKTGKTEGQAAAKAKYNTAVDAGVLPKNAASSLGKRITETPLQQRYGRIPLPDLLSAYNALPKEKQTEVLDTVIKRILKADPDDYSKRDAEKVMRLAPEFQDKYKADIKRVQEANQ